VSLAGLDLNLLIPLRELLEVRHVTRAAERIHLSQSAMSAALSRLRRHFHDDLLVRVGGGYELTPLGRELLPLVVEAVKATENTFNARSGFDPSTSDRHFVITASGYAACVLGPPLRAWLRARAPATSVAFHAMPRHGLSERDILESDLLVGPLEFGFPGAHQVLFTDDFVCLLDAQNPASREPDLSVETLGRYAHAVTSFMPGLATGADRLLESLGVDHRVAVVVDDWLPLPWLISGTDLIALVPRRLAALAALGGRLVIREVPGGGRGEFVEGMFWHPSRAADAGLRWLRTTLRAALDPPDATS
jgi:DNA-binding transcriptional LysR family regulator